MSDIAHRKNIPGSFSPRSLTLKPPQPSRLYNVHIPLVATWLQPMRLEVKLTHYDPTRPGYIL
jgi:hypothetical protein